MFTVVQESDDEPSDTPHANYSGEQSKKKSNYVENSPDDDRRRSRSSLSENCSSPNEQYDDYRPSLEDNDNENGEVSMRASFQDTNENSFYNKNSSQYSHDNDAFGTSYSEKSKRMMSNMGFKPGRGLGKYEHGRVEPVEASTQKGRRGLGLRPSEVGQVPQDFKWSPDDAKPEAKEEVVSIFIDFKVFDPSKYLISSVVVNMRPKYIFLFMKITIKPII